MEKLITVISPSGVGQTQLRQKTGVSHSTDVQEGFRLQQILPDESWPCAFSTRGKYSANWLAVV
jgi:hypothetical protein